MEEVPKIQLPKWLDDLIFKDYLRNRIFKILGIDTYGKVFFWEKRDRKGNETFRRSGKILVQNGLNYDKNLNESNRRYFDKYRKCNNFEHNKIYRWRLI